MIENKLMDSELRHVFEAIFSLSTTAEIISAFQKLFPSKIETLEEIMQCSRDYKITYLGYELIIFGLNELSTNTVYLSATFRNLNSWKDIFKNTKQTIKLTIEDICYEKIEGSYPAEIYDESSYPLIISLQRNEKYNFVHVYFNANCYERTHGKTTRKDNWEEYLNDVHLYERQKADELLINGFNF